MDLLGLELCDAGILVAGGEPPRLLRIDEDSLESPGFALPEKKALTDACGARSLQILPPLRPCYALYRRCRPKRDCLRRPQPPGARR